MQELPNISIELLNFLTRRERECYRLLQEGLKQELIARKLYYESQSGVSRMQKRIIIKIKDNLLTQ